MNKNNLYLKAVLLIGFIAINIFPGGCFSWGSGPATVPPTVLPYPEVTPVPYDSVIVNGEVFIKSLQCVQRHPRASSQDKNNAFYMQENIRSLLSYSKDGKVPVNKTEINNFMFKFPDCNF